MKIIRGKTKPKGLRVVIYGVHGVGKTTLASKLNNAVYMDYEGGTHGIDCAKVSWDELPKTYASVIGAFKEFKRDHQGFDNLIVDSADQLEDTFDKSYSSKKGIKSIFAVDDFFRTQKAHERSFSDVLDAAGDLVNSGMNVIFIAHEQQRKVEPLEHNGGKTYDHSDLKLSKKCSQALLQWADVVIFCAFKTFLIEGEKKGDKAHAGGGKRWCFCSYSPDWEAKHRACVELPDDCSLEKMTSILPKIIADSTDPINGISTAEMISSEKTSSNTGSSAAAPSEAPPKAPVKTVEPGSTETTLPDCAATFLKLLDQYGVAEEKMRAYAAGKLNDRYGVDFATLPIVNWPEEAVLWLNRGFDKIAPKLKD